MGFNSGFKGLTIKINFILEVALVVPFFCQLVRVVSYFGIIGG